MTVVLLYYCCGCVLNPNCTNLIKHLIINSCLENKTFRTLAKCGFAYSTVLTVNNMQHVQLSLKRIILQHFDIFWMFGNSDNTTGQARSTVSGCEAQFMSSCTKIIYSCTNLWHKHPYWSFAFITNKETNKFSRQPSLTILDITNIICEKSLQSIINYCTVRYKYFVTHSMNDEQEHSGGQCKVLHSIAVL